MGRIIYDAATTLNGWIADEADSLEWLFSVEGGTEPAPGLYPDNAGVIVEGSTTYEWVLNHEKVLEEPQRWQEMFGEKPTFVFTTRDLPRPDGADVRFLSGSVSDNLSAIREAAGEKDIWILGGGDLPGQFFDVGELDEIALSVAPVSLNGGAPVLPRRIESNQLKLKSANAVGQFARLVYEVC